jgi:hypothetical protein
MVAGELGILDNHASAPFLAGSFVKLSSGKVVPVVTTTAITDTACGFCLDASATAATPQSNPPYSIFNTSSGLRHYPFALDNMIFLANCVHTPSTTGNIGAGSAQVSNVVIGQTYGIFRATTGTYAQYQFVDLTVTAAASGAIVQVVEIPSSVDGEVNGSLSTLYNPLVAFRFVEANIVRL